MKISVIIPFYNLEAYVDSCLGSVLAAYEQAACGLELEVLCVDDGSTDGTGGLLDTWRDRFALRCPHFVPLVIHQVNGGEGAARNAGLRAATGDWVTFLDGDDVWLPNLLAEAGALLSAHPQADIANLRFAPFEDGASVPQMTSSTSVKSFDLTAEVCDEVLLGVGVYPTFFRRAKFSAVAFAGLPLGADRLYVASCLGRARRVVLSDAVVHAYRVRPGSMARAVWSARKVMSQCDYAVGALAELARSGRRIGSGGASYLASLWLSDVSAHLRRLSKSERAEAWTHWRASWSSEAAGLLPPRFAISLALLWRCSRFPRLTLAVAHVLRKLGVI